MTVDHDTQFENHFPIPVMVSHHAGLEQLHGEVFALIQTLRGKFLDDAQENEALSGSITTYGGYQTSRKMMFLDRPEAEIRRLRDQIILPGAQRYLAHVYGDTFKATAPRVVSWANILSAGDWQAPHMHPTIGNLASGVYYVNVPDKPKPQGCIEFLNPHPASHYHAISLTRRLYPRAGDLIVFPPYYIHYVYPFKGDGERAIIAFDIIKQATQFVF